MTEMNVDEMLEVAFTQLRFLKEKREKLDRDHREAVDTVLKLLDLKAKSQHSEGSP